MAAQETPTSTRAAVDVSGVFARAEGQARMFAGLAGDPRARQLVRDLVEASHAVAELIEAVESYAEAEAALANRELAGINAEPHEKLQRRVHSAREELDAALARVKGGAQ